MYVRFRQYFLSWYLLIQFRCTAYYPQKKKHHFVLSLVVSRVFLMFAVTQPVSLIPNPILLKFISFLVSSPSCLWLISFFLWCAATIRLKNILFFLLSPEFVPLHELLFLSFYSLRTAQRNSSFSYFDIRSPHSIFKLNLH
jgi:hypothetical protein